LIIEKTGMALLLKLNNRSAIWMRDSPYRWTLKRITLGPFAGAWSIASPQPCVCFLEVIAKFTRTAVTTFATKAISPPKE